MIRAKHAKEFVFKAQKLWPHADVATRRKIWIEAMKSGHFVRGSVNLHTKTNKKGDAFCPLGLLEVLSGNYKPELDPSETHYTYNGESCRLTEKTRSDVELFGHLGEPKGTKTLRGEFDLGRAANGHGDQINPDVARPDEDYVQSNKGELDKGIWQSYMMTGDNLSAMNDQITKEEVTFMYTLKNLESGDYWQ